MPKKIILTCLITLVITFTVSTTVVIADDLNELQDRKNQLNQQISQANEQVENIQIELTDTLQQIDNLEQKIETYQTEIDEVSKNLEETQNEISIVEEKLTNLENNYKIQRETFQNRIIAQYEAGDIQYLDVLLSSNTLSEFISNYYLIGEIAKYDRNLLDNIDRQKKQIQNIRIILSEKEKSLKTLKTNKENTSVALENAKVIKNSYAKQLTDEEKETQEKIAGYQRELDNLEAQIVAITSIKVGEDYVGGEFAWPAPGYSTITSKYGMRVHPILKTHRIHSGTDIAMPMGAYIIAANDGVVTKAGYSTTGYGNMVLIDHGGGVSTLYGHGSEILVQAGQTVKRGDIIMKAGSTGWSTGPHLHFEVRINGQHVDSLPYITGKKIETKSTENNAEESTQNTENAN